VSLFSKIKGVFGKYNQPEPWGISKKLLFPPFATTFDGDSAECSKHLGRARGMLSLMCRSVPPVKSRTETTADGIEIRVTTNPNHIYIKGGGKFYTSFLVYGADIQHHYANRDDTNSLIPKIPTTDIPALGNYYWFSGGAFVTWYNVYRNASNFYNYIVIKGQILSLFNQPTLPEINSGRIFVFCCAIKNGNLIVITGEFQFTPDDGGFTGWKIFVSKFKLLINNSVELIYKRKLSDVYFSVITDARVNGYFTKKADECFISANNSLANVARVEFNSDYTTNTISGVGNSTNNTVACHGNDMVCINPYGVTTTELKYYDNVSKSFLLYSNVPAIPYKLISVLYSSKTLGITVSSEYTDIVMVAYNDWRVSLKVSINGIVALETEVRTRYSIAATGGITGVVLYAGFSRYAFDGRILAVGFTTHPAGAISDFTYSPQSGAIVIDTKLNTHRVLFPTALPPTLTGNFTISDIPKGAINGS